VSDRAAVPLGDLLRVKHGFAFAGSGFGVDADRPQLVTPGNFAVGGGFQSSRVKSFEGEFPSSYVLNPGDLVITMTDLSKAGDTLGLPAIIPSGQVYLHNQRVGLVQIKDHDRVSSRFLNFYLRTDAYRSYILGTASGSTVRHTSPGKIESFVALIPDISEQQAIAEVLGALDDKIAANTRLARIADDYVRAQYEEVERTSKESIAVSKLATARRDTVDPGSTISGTLYVGLEHIPRRSMWLGDSGYAVDVTSQKSRFERDDILFGKLRPYFHKVVAAPHAGVSSTDILVLTATIADLNGFVLAALASDSVVASVTAMSEGTRMPRTSWKDLSSVEVPWPGEVRAKEFSAEVIVLRSAVEGLLEENKTLAATRDALLPQLMSGKLRVLDAEKAVEAVV